MQAHARWGPACLRACVPMQQIELRDLSGTMTHHITWPGGIEIGISLSIYPSAGIMLLVLDPTDA